jgi:hypothetical protein
MPQRRVAVQWVHGKHTEALRLPRWSPMGPPPLRSRRWLRGPTVAATTVKFGEDADGGGEGAMLFLARRRDAGGGARALDFPLLLFALREPAAHPGEGRQRRRSRMQQSRAGGDARKRSVESQASLASSFFLVLALTTPLSLIENFLVNLAK